MKSSLLRLIFLTTIAIVLALNFIGMKRGMTLVATGDHPAIYQAPPRAEQERQEQHFQSVSIRKANGTTSNIGLYKHSNVPNKGHPIIVAHTSHTNNAAIGFNSNHSSFLSRKEYSAKPCWLEPAWGMVEEPAAVKVCLGSGKRSGGRQVQVQERTQIYNTTASQLACPDEKQKYYELRHIRETNLNGNHTGLTIALLYYANPAMLLHQLETFSNYSKHIKEKITILIIDDGSPAGLRATDYFHPSTYGRNGIDEDDNDDTPLRIRVARIATEKAWNIGGARNLAFFLADTTRALLLDLDIQIPEESIQDALSWPTKNKTHTLAHRFNRKLLKKKKKKGNKDGDGDRDSYRVHPAIAVLDVDAYWQSGGCDEDFCGSYGYTDVHFWLRWKMDPTRLQLNHMKTYITEFGYPPCSPVYIQSNSTQEMCNAAIEALVKPDRDTSINKGKMEKKKQTNCWSNRYLRFRWLLETF